ncbi:MAG: aminotransferase class I/II-fold pyridoxal phosphate-dependent enzyme [Syntrophomonadaceae bacterium]
MEKGRFMAGVTPLYNALKAYREHQPLRLHMPGHGGMGLPGCLEWQAPAAFDVTEIPGLDDLHQPQGVIAQAQEMLARAVGAEISLMLVNGASSGIHSLLLALGDKAKVMIPRNAHRSFYGGLVISGAWPVYIPCRQDEELGLALTVTAQAVQEIWENNPEVDALFITSPSYYGTCADIESLAAIAAGREKPLMVDEAHGAHFPFHPDYPGTALDSGAAASVYGLHKTWPVFTQGACLNLSPGFSRHAALRTAHDLLTTTSPSYPLMASIDLARSYMETYGGEHLERARLLADEYKPRVNSIPGLKCPQGEWLQMPGVTGLDPLKALVSVSGLSLTGYQLDALLRREYQIQVEMAAENYILAMFSLWHEQEDWQHFYHALEEIARRYQSDNRYRVSPVVPPAGELVMSPRQAFFAAKRSLPLAECRNRVAGEMVAAYPPGIPCLVPGETISEEVWEYLLYLQETGAHIQGPERPDLARLVIIE